MRGHGTVPFRDRDLNSDLNPRPCNPNPNSNNPDQHPVDCNPDHQSDPNCDHKLKDDPS